MAKVAAVVLVAVAGLSAGCGSDDPVSTASTDTTVAPTTTMPVAASVEGRTWILDPEASGVVLDSGDVWIVLEDGRLSMRNVCNSAGGSYRIDGDQLIVTERFSTLAGCLVGQDLENRITQPATVRPGGDTLRIDGAADAGGLVFTELPQDPVITHQRMEGSWQIAPVGGGAPAPALLTIDAEGRYGVTVDCHRYEGRWQIDEGRITTMEEGSDSATPDGEEAPAGEVCTPGVTSPAETLVMDAISGLHFRAVDDGVEVVDGRGQAVALLLPASP